MSNAVDDVIFLVITGLSSDLYIALCGHFVREDGRLQYNGGEIDVWDGFDLDFLTTWIVKDLCKQQGYVRFDNIY